MSAETIVSALELILRNTADMSRSELDVIIDYLEAERYRLLARPTVPKNDAGRGQCFVGPRRPVKLTGPVPTWGAPVDLTKTAAPETSDDSSESDDNDAPTDTAVTATDPKSGDPEYIDWFSGQIWTVKSGSAASVPAVQSSSPNVKSKAAEPVWSGMLSSTPPYRGGGPGHVDWFSGQTVPTVQSTSSNAKSKGAEPVWPGTSSSPPYRPEYTDWFSGQTVSGTLTAAHERPEGRKTGLFDMPANATSDKDGRASEINKDDATAEHASEKDEASDEEDKDEEKDEENAEKDEENEEDAENGEPFELAIDWSRLHEPDYANYSMPIDHSVYSASMSLVNHRLFRYSASMSPANHRLFVFRCKERVFVTCPPKINTNTAADGSGKDSMPAAGWAAADVYIFNCTDGIVVADMNFLLLCDGLTGEVERLSGTHVPFKKEATVSTWNSCYSVKEFRERLSHGGAKEAEFSRTETCSRIATTDLIELFQVSRSIQARVNADFHPTTSTLVKTSAYPIGTPIPDPQITVTVCASVGAKRSNSKFYAISVRTLDIVALEKFLLPACRNSAQLTLGMRCDIKDDSHAFSIDNHRSAGMVISMIKKTYVTPVGTCEWRGMPVHETVIESQTYRVLEF